MDFRFSMGWYRMGTVGRMIGTETNSFNKKGKLYPSQDSSRIGYEFIFISFQFNLHLIFIDGDRIESINPYTLLFLFTLLLTCTLENYLL